MNVLGPSTSKTTSESTVYSIQSVSKTTTNAPALELNKASGVANLRLHQRPLDITVSARYAHLNAKTRKALEHHCLSTRMTTKCTTCKSMLQPPQNGGAKSPD